MKLYKYKSLPSKNNDLSLNEKQQIEFCRDILINNRLFMAPRETLNDPFEGMAIPIALGIAGSGSYAQLGLPHPIVEDYMNQYKILSLSEDPKNPIMWAHYANNYYGMCFEFELKKHIEKVHKVSYIEHQFDTIYDPEDDEFIKAIEKSLLCKSNNWSYEKEYRIITKENESFFYFDQFELTGIILGHRVVCSQGILNLAKEKNIPIYYTLTSTRNYEINIINKLPVELDIGTDTLINLPCFKY